MINAEVIICHCRSARMGHVCWWKSICPLSLLLYVCKSFCTFGSRVFLSSILFHHFQFAISFALVFIPLFAIDLKLVRDYGDVHSNEPRPMHVCDLTWCINALCTHYDGWWGDDYDSYYIFRMQCEVMIWCNTDDPEQQFLIHFEDFWRYRMTSDSASFLQT